MGGDDIPPAPAESGDEYGLVCGEVIAGSGASSGGARTSGGVPPASVRKPFFGTDQQAVGRKSGSSGGWCSPWGSSGVIATWAKCR